MKKILFIAPHLSTGGLPQYLYKKIELLKNDYQIYVIEYEDVTGGVLVVQKNRILDLIGSNLITLPWGSDKNIVLNHINDIKPDIIHFEEMPEYFMSDNIAEHIYTPDRTYLIFETSHDSSFDINNKRFLPDKFILVSKYQKNMLGGLNVDMSVVEYPIEYKDRPDRTNALKNLNLDPNYKHVLHVGLFTPRKNQAEFFEYAKLFKNENVIFHCVGNLADNFRYYWEPLLENKPDNVIVHGEKSNTDDFYSAMDLFLFTSKGHTNDKETMPLVIREAISWNIPIVIYNLPVYENYFDKFENISYLKYDNIDFNCELIKSKLFTKKNTAIIISTYPNNKHIEDITNKAILAIKDAGYPIILTSHFPITEDLQENVDYFIYDKNNILVYHDFYSSAWQNSSDVDMLMNIRTEGNHLYHGSAVYTNYYNGISLANKLGYENAICFNYDMILSDNSVLTKIDDHLNKSMGFFNHYNALEGDAFRTVIFGVNTNFFVENFPLIKNGDDYLNWQKNINSNSNGLENMFYHNLKNKITQVKTINEIDYKNMLNDCQFDMCSMVEYFNVLPIKDKPNQFAVWLSTSNVVDDRNFNILIEKNYEVIDEKDIFVKTSQYWYWIYDFNINDTYNILLYEMHRLKKIITIDNNYFNNTLKNNGLLTIK